MHTTLVSTDELAANLGAWRIFDCRHDLTRPEWGEAQYRVSHIPGALFAHLDRDLSAPKSGKNGRHPLPDPQTFAAWVGRQGLKPDDQVVCYDGAYAARLWWMLRWVGHTAVAVLDGGFAKWMREGRAVTTDVKSFAATQYPVKVNTSASVPVDAVHKGLGKITLVDARTPVRWRGEQEPIDPAAGRIPGALNRSSGDNVQADGVFKPKEVLRKEFEAILKGAKASDAIHYCGSGVTAAYNLLAAEHAGLTGGRLYAGSWSEWSADSSRPQEKG